MKKISGKMSFDEAAAEFAPEVHLLVLWALFNQHKLKCQKRRSRESWVKIFRLISAPPKKKGYPVGSPVKSRVAM